MEKGNSLLEAKKKNRILIRNEIFRRAYATRTEIARDLGLTLPTVTTSVNRMLQEGLVEEIPMPEQLLRGGKGRRPLVIAFRPSAAFFIGLDLAMASTKIVLMDLGQHTLAEESFTAVNEDYDASVRMIADGVRRFIERYPCKPLAGIGVGLTGIVDHKEGKIRENPYKTWNGKSIQADLERQLGLPVRIDNNSHMRAIKYEMENGLQENHTFAYFFCAYGFNCPITYNYDDLTGYDYTEGEIGLMIIGSKADKPIRLQSYARNEIAAECERQIKDGKVDKQPFEGIEDKGQYVAKMVEMQREGCEAINQIVMEALRMWAVALSNLIVCDNPGMVVLESRLFDYEKNQERFKESLHAILNEGYMVPKVNLIFKNYEPYGAAKGAALCLVKRYYLLS